MTNPDFLPDLQPNDFLPPIQHWTRLGTIALSMVFVGVASGAALVDYNTTVQVGGNIRPETEMSVVQAKSAGTILRIPVRENQPVQRGDIIAELATLDRTQLQTLQTRQQRLQTYIQDYQNRLAYLDAQLQTQQLDNAERDRRLQERTALDRQIRYDQTALQTVTAELGKLVVQAPEDGTILKIMPQTAGQPVQPGDAIAQIVPKNVLLIVKARVDVQDISQVQPGQPVVLRISAYPYPDYGTLNGKVQTISPDVKTVGDGATTPMASFYEVTIQPERPYLQKGDRQFPLQPGMETRADIISRQETVLQTVLRRLRLWVDV
jgi:multidrug efflux pump subunit AcrA (membrane-fusion protein)